MFLNSHARKILAKVVSILLLPTFLLSNVAFAHEIKTSSSTLAPKYLSVIFSELEPYMQRLYSHVTPDDDKPNTTTIKRLRDELAARYKDSPELQSRLADFDACYVLQDAWVRKTAEFLAVKIVTRVKELGGRITIEAAQKDAIALVKSIPGSKMPAHRKLQFIAALNAEFAKTQTPPGDKPSPDIGDYGTASKLRAGGSTLSRKTFPVKLVDKKIKGMDSSRKAGNLKVLATARLKSIGQAVEILGFLPTGADASVLACAAIYRKAVEGLKEQLPGDIDIPVQFVKDNDRLVDFANISDDIASPEMGLSDLPPRRE